MRLENFPEAEELIDSDSTDGRGSGQSHTENWQNIREYLKYAHEGAVRD